MNSNLSSLKLLHLEISPQSDAWLLKITKQSFALDSFLNSLDQISL
jgi:hypothetical protein